MDVHAAPVPHEGTIEEPAGVVDPPQAPRFPGSGWPLLAVALMTLLFLRACVPVTGTSVMPAFDAAAATRIANERALVALGLLGPESAIDEVARALNLAAVNFASGSAEIPADARPVLARAAAVVARLPPDLRFEVAGHTDGSGSVLANQRLSEQRARAVVAVLVSGGSGVDRFTMRGYGDSRPVGNNATERGRFDNRRIEFRPLP
jgi:outer membrane protein OmpA-like peptidoglycan-associated protein